MTFHTLTSVGRKKLFSMSRNVAAFSCCTKEQESLTECVAKYQESISSAGKSKHETDSDFVCQSSKSSKDLVTKNDVAILQRGLW